MRNKWYQNTRSSLQSRMEIMKAHQSLSSSKKRINVISIWTISKQWTVIRRNFYWPHRGWEVSRIETKRIDCIKTTWSTPTSESMSTWPKRWRMTIKDMRSMLFWQRCIVMVRETKDTQTSTKIWLRRLYMVIKAGTSSRKKCSK